MAEVLGAVASGTSIIQLSGQIAKSIIKLKGFWDQVKDAPEDISSLLKDLEILNIVLHELEPQQIGDHTDLVAGSHVFRQSLALCREGSRELNDLVGSLSAQVSSHNKFRRTRGSLKMVMKKEQIKRYKSKLKSAITLLSLSHQTYSRAIAQLQFELLYSTLSKSINPATPATRIHVNPPIPAPHSKIDETLFSTLQTKNENKIDFETQTSISLFDHPLVGSILVSQQHFQLAKNRDDARSCPSGHKILVRYREPSWFRLRAWQLCYIRSQVGWSWTLTTHNIVPDISPQFKYAETGNLSDLQVMIASGEASIFDQTMNGKSLLSIAALYGRVDTCKWLLKQGAHTDHDQFGSVLNEVIYYGGWISFYMGFPMFDIVRILQRKDYFDIFDCSDSMKGSCAFHGPKEVLSWFLNISRDGGREITCQDYMRLALNLSRNTEHNAADLVEIVINNVPWRQALDARDQDGITILHRIASRLGNSFSYEHALKALYPRAWDEGFETQFESDNIQLLPRQRWCSLLHKFDLSMADLNNISLQGTTPLTMGLRTLIGDWTGPTLKQPRAISNFLELWLTNLKKQGVSLLDYGGKESRLLREGYVHKDFYRHSRAKQQFFSRDYFYGTLRLIAMEPSVEPDQWRLWWSEPTDEFAGDFWEMCERSEIRMPGAWEDDIDLMERHVWWGSHSAGFRELVEGCDVHGTTSRTTKANMISNNRVNVTIDQFIAKKVREG